MHIHTFQTNEMILHVARNKVDKRQCTNTCDETEDEKGRERKN